LIIWIKGAMAWWPGAWDDRRTLSERSLESPDAAEPVPVAGLGCSAQRRARAAPPFRWVLEHVRFRIVERNVRNSGHHARL
jgi:hypothetical protein